jgi:hypothetical protein
MQAQAPTSDERVLTAPAHGAAGKSPLKSVLSGTADHMHTTAPLSLGHTMHVSQAH